jgi:mycothiol synthase
MPDIQVRDAHETERQMALKIALSEPGFQDHQAQRICELTQDFLRRCGGSIGGLHLVETAGRIDAACASLDLPGGVSLLMLTGTTPACLPEGLAPLLNLAGRCADRRGRRFVQIMVEPDRVERMQPILEAAGLSHLALLQYMQRSAYDPAPIQAVEQTNWLTLVEADEDSFARVIQRTYIDSLDCPGLTGIRTMAEAIESHRGSGEFDPRGWYLLEHRGEPAGVLITARTPFRPNLEVVYVGLVPAARGKGLGRICLHRAIQRARDLALAAVTLAVDAANRPACRLYEAMGFSVYAHKDVWIRVFHRADEEGLFALPAV